MARERERRGLQDGGDRTATIARWLAQKVRSERVTELVLQGWTGEQDPEVIVRYPRSDAEAHATLADEISGLIQDYADDQGTNISAMLSWVTAEGQPWTSKRFRGRCSKASEEVVHPLDGTMTAQLQQSQRHAEAAVQQVIQMSQQVTTTLARDREQVDERYSRILDSYERMNERLMQHLEAAEKVAEEAAEAAAEATEVAEEAAAVAEEATAAAESGEKDDRLAKVIEIAAKQLTGG
jgi:hypothetical protein